MKKNSILAGSFAFAMTLTALASVEVSVDLGDVAYPPLVNKFGLNEFWDVLKTPQEADTSMDRDEWMKRGQQTSSAIVSGLLELTPTNGKLVDGVFSTTWPRVSGQGMFYRTTTNTVGVQPNQNLTALRSLAQSRGFINFLQIAGVPQWETNTLGYPTYVFTEDNEYVYGQEVQHEQTGNEYRPPLNTQFAEFGEAVANLAFQYGKDHSAGGNAPWNIDYQAPPSIWCLWQEPNHTLGNFHINDKGVTEVLSNEDSVKVFMNFFTPFRKRLHALNPDAMVAGIQLNKGSGTQAGTPDGQSLGGAFFAKATAIIHDEYESADDLGTEPGPNAPTWTPAPAPFPLDFFTIQSYGAAKLAPEFVDASPGRQLTGAMHNMMNARIALLDPWFNKTSIMFNELSALDETGDQNEYDTLDGVGSHLQIIQEILDQPDVSYALFRERLFTLEPTPAPHMRQAWYPLRLIGQASVHRRPVTISDPAAIQCFAASDKIRGTSVLLWNPTAFDVPGVNLTLKNVNFPVQQAVSVLTMFANNAAPIMSPGYPHALANGLNVPLLSNVMVPAHGVVLVQPSPTPLASAAGLTHAQYVRHRVWSDRSETAASYADLTVLPPKPKGMGFYDVRSSTLVAGVNGQNDASGIASVTLKNVPSAYQVKVDLTASGPMGSSGTEKLLGFRVDYIDANTDSGGNGNAITLKTEYYKEATFINSWTPWAGGDGGTTWWPIGLSTGVNAIPCQFLSGSVTLSLNGPQLWNSLPGSERRLMITLILRGFANAATVSARLTDLP